MDSNEEIPSFKRCRVKSVMKKAPEPAAEKKKLLVLLNQQ